MTTLSLEASKKLFELVGEYETEKVWYDVGHFVWSLGSHTDALNYGKDFAQSTAPGYGVHTIPAPTFAELVRILPKIADKKRWIWRSYQSEYDMPSKLTGLYMDAPTEPEGMAKVEEYLKKIL